MIKEVMIIIENFIYENYIEGMLGSFLKRKENDCKKHNSKIKK